MAQDSFSEQYWADGNETARARLAREQYTEYSAFTGTDIKAFILPQGDQLARAEYERRLSELAEVVDSAQRQEEINAARVAAEFEEALLVGAKDPGPARGLAHDTLPLVNLQSITISTFRAKNQVRALGHVNAVGLARGSRTVAGTFILTEFNRDAFWDILTAPYRDINAGDAGAVNPDQMRPFDIMLMFAHEMGNIAIRHIYGLEIVTNGIVYSVQDYYSENTVSYIATDISPLIPLSPAFNGSGFVEARTKLNNLITTVRGTTLGADFNYLREARNPFK
jgi:hypothetical protein